MMVISRIYGIERNKADAARKHIVLRALLLIYCGSSCARAVVGLRRWTDDAVPNPELLNHQKLHQTIEFGMIATSTMKVASTTTAVTATVTDRVASCVAYLLNDENDQTVCFSAAPDPTLHSPSRRHDVCFSADSEGNQPRFR